MKINWKKLIVSLKIIIGILFIIGIIILLFFLFTSQSRFERKYHPKYNFLIIIPSDNVNHFYVKDGKLVLLAGYSPVDVSAKNKFELYNVTNYTETPISYEEVKKLKLSADIYSPDGFKIDAQPNDSRYNPGIGSMNWVLEYKDDKFTNRFLFRTETSGSDAAQFVGWVLD
jgi:hypothetical protein